MKKFSDLILIYLFYIIFFIKNFFDQHKNFLIFLLTLFLIYPYSLLPPSNILNSLYHFPRCWSLTWILIDHSKNEFFNLATNFRKH